MYILITNCVWIIGFVQPETLEYCTAHFHIFHFSFTSDITILKCNRIHKFTVFTENSNLGVTGLLWMYYFIFWNRSIAFYNLEHTMTSIPKHQRYCCLKIVVVFFFYTKTLFVSNESLNYVTSFSLASNSAVR